MKIPRNEACLTRAETVYISLSRTGWRNSHTTTSTVNLQEDAGVSQAERQAAAILAEYQEVDEVGKDDAVLFLCTVLERDFESWRSRCLSGIALFYE